MFFIGNTPLGGHNTIYMQEKTKECKHSFEYKVETVNCKNFNGWFEAKRVIIFCKKCGLVSHDKVNGSSPYTQDLKS